MYQLPVNNLARLRRARKQVKKALGDIGLEFCKEAAEDFKDYCPNEQYVKGTLCLDICSWDPSYSKTQEYRSKRFCCTECQFSSKHYSGYKNHFRNVHRHMFDSGILLNCPYCTFTANKRTLETHVKIFHIPSGVRQGYGGFPGGEMGVKSRMLPGRLRKADAVEKAMYFCKKCTFRDTLYNVVRRHIYRSHFQHIVEPYFSLASESSAKNGGSSVNGNNILCKCCPFSTRNYETLVQHVIEYHERIGAQVTTMIGHGNITLSQSKAFPGMSQKAPPPSPMVSRGHTLTSESTFQPVAGQLKQVSPVLSNQPLFAFTPESTGHPVASQLKQAAPALKNQATYASQQVRVTGSAVSAAAENNAVGVNTGQTQKWKICTVCNELFPENLYSAHFEKAHKAKKIWAMANYIMKIHNFTSKCLLCNRYLPSDTLLNHMLIHGLTCPQCYTAFYSVEKIIEHVSQVHPDDFLGPPGASPLTFDLTIKQDKSANVQLVVMTFNMKESTNGQDMAASAQYSDYPTVRITAPSIIDKKNDPTVRHTLPASLSPRSEVGKTLCPLCFSILKGPLSHALSMHLRERHQVLQTMHPVEKKMTYKCIHCLGVYTSNMVASTITLHLVQCRAIGRSQANMSSNSANSALTLNSSGTGFLKRQLQNRSMANPKRIKLSKESKPGYQAGPGILALDPTRYEHKTYEARKAFLTAYFSRRPYPSFQEVDMLSGSLWLWKSDIANHFATKQKICQRECETRKAAVLLGFDTHALLEVKHELNFPEHLSKHFSVRRSKSLKDGTPNTGRNKQCRTRNSTSKPVICTETISIDSDSEPEMENKPNENGNVDTTQQKNLKSQDPVNLVDETDVSVLQDEKEILVEEASSVEDVPSAEPSSPQGRTANPAEDTTSANEDVPNTEKGSLQDDKSKLGDDPSSIEDVAFAQMSPLQEGKATPVEDIPTVEDGPSLEMSSLQDSKANLLEDTSSVEDVPSPVMSVLQDNKANLEDFSSMEDVAFAEMSSMEDGKGNLVEDIPSVQDDPSAEMSSLQDGKANLDDFPSIAEGVPSAGINSLQDDKANLDDFSSIAEGVPSTGINSLQDDKANLDDFSSIAEGVPSTGINSLQDDKANLDDFSSIAEGVPSAGINSLQDDKANLDDFSSIAEGVPSTGINSLQDDKANLVEDFSVMEDVAFAEVRSLQDDKANLLDDFSSMDDVPFAEMSSLQDKANLLADLSSLEDVPSTEMSLQDAKADLLEDFSSIEGISSSEISLQDGKVNLLEDFPSVNNDSSTDMTTLQDGKESLAEAYSSMNEDVPPMDFNSLQDGKANVPWMSDRSALM